MKILGIRFCTVTPEAEALSKFLDSLGLARGAGPQCGPDDAFSGAIFAAGSSWIEIWQQSAHMRAGVMLQVVVDDADAFAEHARRNGLDPHGPMDAHGERIYSLNAPSGLQVSFQSAL